MPIFLDRLDCHRDFSQYLILLPCKSGGTWTPNTLLLPWKLVSRLAWLETNTTIVSIPSNQLIGNDSTNFSRPFLWMCVPSWITIFIRGTFAFPLAAGASAGMGISVIGVVQISETLTGGRLCCDLIFGNWLDRPKNSEHGNIRQEE